MHPFEGSHLISTFRPEQNDDKMAGTLSPRLVQAVKDALHRFAAKWIEEIQDEVALWEREITCVLMKRLDVLRASRSISKALDVRAALLIEKRRELDADDLPEGEFGSHEHGTPLSGAEIDVAEAGYIIDWHLAESFPYMPWPRWLIPLTVAELVWRDAGCEQRDVAGSAYISGTIEPLIFEEFEGQSDVVLNIITDVQPCLLTKAALRLPDTYDWRSFR